MTTVLNGLVGGLVAAAVALVVARALGDGSPVAPAPSVTPDDDTTRRVVPGSALALAYGGAAGGLLVALDLRVIGVLGVPPTLPEALAASLAWSVVLSLLVAGAVRLAGARTAARGRLRFRRLLAVHLVYGVVLGAWIRLTWLT